QPIVSRTTGAAARRRSKIGCGSARNAADVGSRKVGESTSRGIPHYSSAADLPAEEPHRVHRNFSNFFLEGPNDGLTVSHPLALMGVWTQRLQPSIGGSAISPRSMSPR